MRPNKNNKKNNKPKDDIESQVLEIRRVTRVMAGGKRMSFRATVGVGDKKGKVGVGVAKGADVASAIEKSIRAAKKNIITISVSGHTVAHDIKLKFGSAVILIKPTKEGSGLVAGSAARTICNLAGIQNVGVKILSRSSNPLNIARATIEALKKIKIKN